MASYLDDFQDSQRVMIIAMPVRVGFWMSAADDIRDTQRDDEKELLALERALKTVMKKTGDKAFSNDVVEFALSAQSQWAHWAARDSDVLEDLARALVLIKQTLPADALTAYKKAVYFIAVAVAQAAGEEGGEDDLSKEIMGASLIHKIKDLFSVKTDLSVPENVSAREKAALQKLLQVLKG